MPRIPSLLLLSCSLVSLHTTPASVAAQSSERSTERSLERMADEIAAAAERMAARVEKHANVMADRLEREIERRQKSESWKSRDDRRSRAERDDDWQQARSRIDTTVAFSADGSLDLSSLSGEIIVTGWSRNEAHIKATSDRTRISLDISGSRITLEEERHRSNWSGSRREDTRYEVSVPRGVRVMARTTSGDVSVKGTGGQVEASSTSGDVTVVDASRRVEASSVSGDATVRDVKGNVEASSVSGSVELDGIEGDAHAESTSGDIVLTRLTSREVEASTTSGEVTFSGPLANDGRYEFHSHSGNIELTVPASTNARFSVETFSGELDSAFPITLQPGDRTSRRPRRFEFTVGSGGARVIAETFSGDLEIRKR